MSIHPVSYEALIGFAAGDLGVTESAAVAYHVTECIDCSATLARYRLVSAALFDDDSVEPPLPTLARAQALYSRYHAPAQPRRWRFPLNLTPGLAFAALALLLVVFGALWLIQDAPPDTPFYPVRMIVEGLEIRASKTIKKFVDLATPTSTATPTAENTETFGTEHATEAPLNRPTPSPVRSNAPAAEQAKTPPGQAKTPPGQFNSSAEQAKTPPGQAKTPGGGANSPADQLQIPPGQVKTPPGQAKTPAAQVPTAGAPGTPTATPTSKAQGPSK